VNLLCLTILFLLVLAGRVWANGVEIYTMTQVGWKVICLAELAILVVETVALKYMLRLRPDEAVIDWFLSGREWNSSYASVVMEQLGRHWLDEWLPAEPYAIGGYRFNWLMQFLAFTATLAVEYAVWLWFLRSQFSATRLARSCILLNLCTYAGLSVLIYYYTLNMTPPIF
jgi:hypothetical protein